MYANLSEVMADILLKIIPDPVIWGLILLFGFAVGFAYYRLPASISGFLAFLLVSVIASSLHGVFDTFNMIMFAVSAIIFFFAVMSLGKQY